MLEEAITEFEVTRCCLCVSIGFKRQEGSCVDDSNGMFRSVVFEPFKFFENSPSAWILHLHGVQKLKPSSVDSSLGITREFLSFAGVAMRGDAVTTEVRCPSGDDMSLGRDISCLKQIPGT